MNLGRLIEELSKLPQDAVVKDGFGEPMSYRGYYDQCAFEPKENAKIGDMLAHAKAAIGPVFHGYKGGEYRYSTYTDCWIAEYGCTADDSITMAQIKLWQMEVTK